MGILDDAIRQHLELKRQHGVPEDEVQRQEEEALGPARREAAHQHENGDSEAAEAVADDKTTALAGEDESSALADEAGPPAADQDTVLFDMDDEKDEQDEELAQDEEFEEDEELLSAEEESAAEEGDPDVLEDTPDFLQETPEHDRLWFEQKPPRDFDFD